MHKAWSLALTSKRVNARKTKRLPQAYNALQKVVQYQSGWSLSTCGVEELIAHQRLLFIKHRKKAQTQRWIDECELACCHELGVTYDEIAQLAAKKMCPSMVPIVLHLDENEDVMLARPKSVSKTLLPNSSDSETKKFELR